MNGSNTYYTTSENDIIFSEARAAPRGDGREDGGGGDAGADGLARAPASLPPGTAEIAQALVCYVVEHVAPLVAQLDERRGLAGGQEGTRSAATAAPKAPAKPAKAAERSPTSGFWGDVVGMFGSAVEATVGAVGPFGAEGPEAQGAQAGPPPKFSPEELQALRHKLQSCFWLPAAHAPQDWPAGAPWFGLECGLCAAEEVRFASEEALVGTVRPLVGVTALALESHAESVGAGDGRGGAGALPGFARPPRSFVESLQVPERPSRLLLLEQLGRLEAWDT